MYLYEAKLGKDGENATEMKLSVDRIVFDSGASLNYLPKYEYEQLMKKISEKTKCKESYIQEEIQVCECDEDSYLEEGTFPVIQIKMGSFFNKHWFYLEPRHYVQWDYGMRGCQIFIARESYAN